MTVCYFLLLLNYTVPVQLSVLFYVSPDGSSCTLSASINFSLSTCGREYGAVSTILETLKGNEEQKENRRSTRIGKVEKTFA